jgi:hypothetical protein
MMKKNKKMGWILSLLIVALIASTFMGVPIQKASTTVHVYIDGNKVTFPDAQPFIVKKDSRTLVPIRFIAEDLGYKVDWDEENWNKGGKEDKKVTITNADKVMELFIGQNYAYINGEKKVYDTKPILDGTRTFVPLRFVAENLDCTVDYRHDTKAKLMKVYIMTKDSDFEIPEEPTTPSKIKGNADEMTKDERYAAVRDFFGEYQHQNTVPIFKAIAGSADGAFLWIYEDPGEATIVIQSWYTPSQEKMLKEMGSLELYQMIPPTAKEVLRFYLPNGGADKLYKIIDDGFNFRWDNASNYLDKDLSKMIGSDRPVKMIDAGGLRIQIGTKGK